MGDIYGGIWRNLMRSQLEAHAFMLQRNQMLMRQGFADQLSRGLRQLEDKYDGSATAALEARVNAIAEQKLELVDKREVLGRALDRIEDIRLSLLAARAAAVTGAAEAFDAALADANYYAGTRSSDKDVLTRYPGVNWSGSNTIVTAAGQDVVVEDVFLGVDYKIELDDGTELRPDFRTRVLEGVSPTLDMDALSLVDPLTLPAGGDGFSFTDGTNTYTGTLRTTGGNVGNAWLYNNFATEADRLRAVADIDAAMKRVLRAENNWRLDEALISVGIEKISTDVDALQSEYQAKSDAEFEAKAAERKALMTRMDLAEKTFGLTAASGLSLIQGIFMNEPPEKKDLFGILSGR